MPRSTARDPQVDAAVERELAETSFPLLDALYRGRPASLLDARRAALAHEGVFGCAALAPAAPVPPPPPPPPRSDSMEDLAAYLGDAIA